MNSSIINLYQASQNKLTLVFLEKFFEKKIKKSMKLCPMKPLTKGQEADIKAYFKKHFNPLVASSIYAIAKIALDFLRYAHLYHVITATQVMCVVIVVLFIFLNRRQAKTTKLYSDE